VSDTSEACYSCAEPAQGTRGVIYVRRQIGDTYQSVPICYACWNEENPDRPIDADGKPVFSEGL